MNGSPRRRALPLITALVAGALTLPAPVAADDDKDERGKGKDKDDDKGRGNDEKRQPAPRQPAPAPPPPTARPAQNPAQNVTQTGPFTAPQGTERMVSQPMRLAGPEGTGAGPVRLDVEGARPNSTYEVLYVPSSNPTLAVVLGQVRTDGAGAFKGTAPEPMPAIAEPGRTGHLVLSRKA
jgi:hypothetical protein